MNTSLLKRFGIATAACMTALLVARADNLVNNFDDPFDYAANGILGNTNWDGVYLRFGDISGNPNAGGSGNGNTVVASTTSPFASFLNLQNAGGDWSGAANDGFFLYKVVAGDFDMSVLSVPARLGGATAYDNRANNFAGLMIRAYHTNNSGAPYSTTVTNSVENSVRLWRFHASNLDGQIRRSTNGANIEDTYAPDTSNLKTNETRYYRIVRQASTNFFFYWKTNLADGWVQITNAATPNGVMVLTNMESVKMQVGIAQAAFSTANRDAVFDDFQLSGSTVTLPSVLPPGPTANSIVSADVNNNSVNLSWTTNGGDGSLVIIRRNGPVIASPLQGESYAGNLNFSLAGDFGAANSRIVYSGPATNIVVTGLGGSNNTYRVAVYSYTTSSPPIVYNTANPATTTFIGPGRVASVSFTVDPTSIPRGGAASATVTATYNSGDVYDVSSETTTIWNSANPSVALAGNGVLTGIGNGSAEITATYAGVTGTNTVSVTDPTFTDNFDTSRNYLSNGVSGSAWDGVYLKAGDVPFQTPAANYGPQPGRTRQADANVTSNGVLTVSHSQTGWEGNENDGFLLYKRVPGDFQCSVRIVGYTNLAFHFPGLHARLINTTNGSPDAPGGTANAANPMGRESAIRWMRFDEFAISTSARVNLNGGNTVRDNVDGENNNYWLLMRRVGTTFTFFKRANPTDPWIAIPGNTLTLATAAGRPMQVGIGASTFDSGAAFRTVWFDDFMLHAAGIAPGTPPPVAASGLSFAPNLDGTITLSWTPGAGSDGSLVVMRANSPVSSHPIDGVTYTANAAFGNGSNLGMSNYVVYLGPGSSVTVSNLIPGSTYYGAVYSYSGAGAGTAYNRNTVIGSQLAVGVLQSVSLTLPRGNQLVNSGVLPFTSQGIYSGGITNDVGSSVTVFSDPLGHVVGLNGLLTGLTNGPATVYVALNGVTNSRSVTVRSPIYSDEFNVNHDYILNRHTNTIWNGVYLNDGDLPGSVNGGQAGFTTGADANISSNGVLTVTNVTGGWEGAENDAFFLFKYAPADFQMAVQIVDFESDDFNNPGLLARAFVEGGSSWTNNGAGEDWVSWTRFDQFGIGTYARLTLNNGTAINTQPLNNGQYYLLMTREGGTTFRFYQRTNITDAWVPAPSGTTYTEPTFANLAMQVGLISPTFNNGGIPRYTQFAHFMLDIAGPILRATPAGANVILSWPAAPGFVLQSSPAVAPTSWSNVPGTPVYNNGQYELTLPATSAAAFFRLVQ